MDIHCPIYIYIYIYVHVFGIFTYHYKQTIFTLSVAMHSCLITLLLDSSPQTGVVKSGVSVSSSVTFPANSQAHSTINLSSFTLTDDDTALELNEQYQLRLTSSSITDNVNLGAATTITIVDDDGKFIIC